MPPAHRETDLRYCKGKTVVQGQSTVFVNNLLWAVNGDPDDHGLGFLRAYYEPRNVYIENKLVICAPGDHAYDDVEHPESFVWPETGSPNVVVYPGAGGT